MVSERARSESEDVKMVSNDKEEDAIGTKNTLWQVINVGPVIELSSEEKQKTGRNFQVRLKTQILKPNGEYAIRNPKVNFGLVKEQKSDYYIHADEKTRFASVSRTSKNHRPTDSRFWKYFFLNTHTASFVEAYDHIETLLENNWGYKKPNRKDEQKVIISSFKFPSKPSK